MRCLDREQYTVGWVCALPVELAAAQELLDEEHDDQPSLSHDDNVYSLGRIGAHNIVLVGLPAGQVGLAAAGTVAAHMSASFPAIRFVLTVGVGGGVPSDRADIRLGDVVVSHPENDHGGVIQYDLGKSTPRGFERTGFVDAPPLALRNAVTKLRALQTRGRNQLTPHLTKLGMLPGFAREQAGRDVLFEAAYEHEGGAACQSCKQAFQKQRPVRMSETPVVHYGTIASANQVMRHGTTRDSVSAAFKGVLCFDMEAAGLMGDSRCLVIRGICDYADSHKNKSWQPYAASAAAAYAKELLSVVSPVGLPVTQTVAGATEEPPVACVPTKQPPVYHLPFQENRQFTGRSELLDKLHQKLFIDQDCTRTALVGLGGVGKTQIALQFVASVKKDHPDRSVFWVPAVSVATFEQAYQQIAKTVGLTLPQDDHEDIKELVQRSLSLGNAQEWLLIVDNADDMGLMQGNGQDKGLLDYLPESETGLILFTTRHHEVAQALAGSNMVEVSGMHLEDAMSLFKKSLVSELIPDNDEEAVGLVTELDHLPLAIVQAASYMNTKKMSVKRYKTLLNSTEEDAIFLLSKSFGGNARYKNSENAVAKTWLVTFNQVVMQDAVAAELLEFISHIEWKGIPFSLLPAFEPRALKDDAIGVLTSYSFLTGRGDGKTFDMHRLVHLATRIWIRQKGRHLETGLKALRHMSEVFPLGDWAYRETWREYLPHAVRIVKDDNLQDTAYISELYRRTGDCLHSDGKMRESLAWQEKSCAWRDRHLADDDPDRLSSQYSLALAYHANGNVAEAIELLEVVAELEVKVYGEDHDDRLMTLHQLAVSYQEIGRYDAAVEVMERVLCVNAKHHEESSLDRLGLQDTLARIYVKAGRLSEAVKLLEAVVTMRRKTLGEHDLDRVSSEQALAVAYLANGQFEEAVDLITHVAAMYATQFDESHPTRLIAQLELARAYFATEQYEKALELTKIIVKIRAEVFQPDHPRLLESRHELGRAYFMTGQCEKGIEILESVATTRSRVRHDNHPELLATQHALALAYDGQGRTDEALELLETVVARKVKVYAKDHPSRLRSERELSRIRGDLTDCTQDDKSPTLSDSETVVEEQDTQCG